MENWKKFYLFILSLLVYSHCLTAGEQTIGTVGVVNENLKPYSVLQSSAKAALFSESGHAAVENAGGAFAAFNEFEFRKTILKYKKKIKRAYTFSTRLKHPVKEIENVSINIFTKEIYSKPFFLSHLHQFLFRLTPF